MNNPLVSVIMPAYNAERFVEQAIRSILNQSYSNFELLVADDGSTDGTKKILDQFLADKRVAAFHNTANLGYLLTSNKLFEKCNGDFITFMDADDWSHPERLSLMLAEFQKDENLSCVGSFVTRVDADGNEIGTAEFETSYEAIKKGLPDKFAFVGSALMIRKNVLEETGLYDEHFNRIGSEDLYWGGLIILKFKTINIAQPLYYYRASMSSVSSKNSRSVKGQLSKELAQIALRKKMLDDTNIFQPRNSKLLNETMNYLLMKYNFWNGNFFSGLSFYFKCVFKNRMRLDDKNKLLKMYAGKWVKNIAHTSK